MAEYIVNTDAEISVYEKIFLAAILQNIADTEIRGYVRHLIRYSAVFRRTVTGGYGMYVDFQTFVPNSQIRPVPETLVHADALFATLIENCQINKIPNNSVDLLLYLNEDKTALKFLEITLMESDFEEAKLAGLVFDRLYDFLKI